MGTVARVIEISAESGTSFEDAISTGVERAAQTLRNIKSVWVKEQHVDVTDGRITGHRVHMLVTFVLDE
jgi:flavin-binding protein dodecin